jgi:hypothetical protein
MQARQRRLNDSRCLHLRITSRNHLEACTLECSGHTIKFLASLVVGSLHLEKARSTGRATMYDTTAKDITSFSDEDQRRIRAMRGGCCVDIGYEYVTRKQPIDGRSQGIITAHEIAKPTPSGRVAGVRDGSSLRISDDQRSAAGILILEQDQRRDSGINTAHDNGVSHVTKCSRDSSLRTVFDMQQ